MGKESLTALYPNCGESLITIWGKKNKTNSTWFDDKKRTYGALLQYSSCSTSETWVAAELCLFDSIEWSTLELEMVDIDNNMDNGHRRCLVDEYWRICWILMMPIRVYLLLFQIPTPDTYPEFLIEQCPRVSVPVSNCWCPNIELRYLVYYYYTALRQWVIAIVYCTKQ